MAKKTGRSKKKKSSGPPKTSKSKNVSEPPKKTTRNASGSKKNDAVNSTVNDGSKKKSRIVSKTNVGSEKKVDSKDVDSKEDHTVEPKKRATVSSKNVARRSLHRNSAGSQKKTIGGSKKGSTHNSIHKNTAGSKSEEQATYALNSNSTTPESLDPGTREDSTDEAGHSAGATRPRPKVIHPIILAVQPTPGTSSAQTIDAIGAGAPSVIIVLLILLIFGRLISLINETSTHKEQAVQLAHVVEEVQDWRTQNVVAIFVMVITAVAMAGGMIYYRHVRAKRARYLDSTYWGMVAFAGEISATKYSAQNCLESVSTF